MKLINAMDKYFGTFQQGEAQKDEETLDSIRIIEQAKKKEFLLTLLLGLLPDTAMAVQFYLGYEFGQFVATQEKGVAELERMAKL